MKINDYEKAETTNIDFKETVELSRPKSWLKSVSNCYEEDKKDFIELVIGDGPLTPYVFIKNLKIFHIIFFI